MSERDVRRGYFGSALLATFSTSQGTECVSERSRLEGRTPPHLDGVQLGRRATGHASVAPSDPSPMTLGTRRICAVLQGQDTMLTRRCGARTEPPHPTNRKWRCSQSGSWSSNHASPSYGCSVVALGKAISSLPKRLSLHYGFYTQDYGVSFLTFGYQRASTTLL